jgi:peroxiredoxin
VKLAQLAQLVFIAVAAIAVYGFVRTGIDAERRRSCGPLCTLGPDYAARNRLAPDFELDALGGGRVRLSELRGRAVILNFWTKHCRPCLEEMPSLAELGRTLQGREDLALVTICTDETREDVAGTLTQVLGGEPPFAVLLDPEAEIVTGRFGTKLFPETWLIDPDGIIRARFDGPRDWADPLAVDLAESLLLPTSCPVEFTQRAPVGPFASLCD